MVAIGYSIIKTIYKQVLRHNYSIQIIDDVWASGKENDFMWYLRNDRQWYLSPE